ncbi:MAG: TlyA family rRNA (cytidine-2'-O)-methyltransferase [Chloroflexota bacterium]|nr:TlyA family rRNA (cytidine-2'-O)-methyltransferase [Chloroflexota bacterium]
MKRIQKQSATLRELIRRRYPESPPGTLIEGGRVQVGGRIVRDPESLVRRGVSVVVLPSQELRGERKLAAALQAFAVNPGGLAALDLGAAAGGFTRALLNAGVARVYAVDVGHGQLLGSLRQEHRVINLEATNISELTTELVPEAIDLVTVDLSYLSLARAVPQLGGLEFAPDATLIALVKPMFELSMATPPTDSLRLTLALTEARLAIDANGWRSVDDIQSPMTGARGAIEYFVHAERRPR